MTARPHDNPDQPESTRPSEGDAPEDAIDPSQDNDDTGLDGSEDEESEALVRRFELGRDSDQRLDVFIQRRLRGVSRHQVQKLINGGGVTVNGKPAKRSTQLRAGDVVEVVLPPPPSKYLEPEPIPLDILYEDDGFIVVNKQANLIVHPARSHLSGTLLNALAYHFQQNSDHVTDVGATYEDEESHAHDAGDFSPPGTPGDTQNAPPRPQHPKPPSARQQRIKKSRQKGTGVWGLSSVGADEARPGIVHRLDKNTTGVMVVAKRDEAHWKIARQFEDRSTLKAYLALVHGEFDAKDVGGCIDEPIGKHPTIREAYAVRRDRYGKDSVTLYRVRQRFKGYTLLELELKTGRTHQIRVHLQYLGHPIAGDIVYGGEVIGRHELDHPPTPAGARRFLTFARTKAEGDKLEAEAPTRDDLIIAHPCLHAAMLRFTHPATSQPVTFTAPLHEPMLGLVCELQQRPVDGAVASEGCWVDLDRAIPFSA